MLKLYNKEHEAISAILNIKDYKIEYLLSGEDSLEFSLSISDENINLLQEECYIRNELNEYVVKEIDPSNDFKRFNCILNLEDIKAKSIFNFETENNNIDDTIRLAIAGTGWVLVDSNITKRRTVRLKNTNALEVLREIRKVFKIDYRFDSINKKIYVYEQYGSDKGVYFSDELNLTDLKFPSDTYEYITRIIPIGKDGLKISSVNGGKEYIDNFQYTNKVIEYIWEDNRYTDAQSLKDDAIAKLNELSKPKKVYEANVYDLAKYSDEYNFLEFFLGDTITILSKKDNFKDKQRIVKYIQYPKEPYKNTCELGNTTLTFEELQQENEYKNQVLNNITTDNNTLDGSKVDEISTTQIKDFDVEVGRVVNLEVVNAKIDNLVANDVNITGQLNAVKADIGTLNANVANIDELVVKHTATINELNANKANISDLNATNATIGILESKVANIDHILAGNITADNIQAGTITAGSGIIADGAIGNAQISSIDAGKIESGTIDTSKITVAGPNSNLKISGNRLQVFQGIGSQQIERVSLGDVNNDGSIYGFRVRGSDGKTILIDENGVKEEGITDGSITNEKISDNANIDGSKLDINSVVRNINKDGTEVIQGTKINVSGTNLETKLSTITQKQTEDSERITQAYSKITANENKINLKVDNQTYQTDKNNINTALNKNTSEISLLKDKIALKVEQSDITNAVNSIVVGSQNIIRNSGLFKNTDYWTSNGGNGITVEEKDGFSCLKANGSYRQTVAYDLKGSATYITECNIMFNKDMVINSSTPYHWYFQKVLANGSTQANGSGGRVEIIQGAGTARANTWHKIILKLTTTTLAEGERVVFKPYIWQSGLTTAITWWLKNMQLKEGDKITDWSPNPEDINAEILAVDSKATTINNKVSEITADLNSITQRVSSTETTTTSLTTQMNAVDGKINTAKNEAITGARQIPDTRNRNENPLWYIQNYPRQTITEFKYANVIGIGSSAIYGTLETKVPWNDKSGGYPVQTFRSNSTSTYERKGTSDTAWGAWKQIEDTSGAQAKANQALNDAKAYTTTEITKTNTKVSSIETNLNGITQRVSSTETTTTTLTNKLNELQIGGRNLIRNSNSLRTGPASTNITSSITSDGYLQIVAQSGNGNWFTGFITTSEGIEDSFKEGEKFTISFTVKSPNSTAKPDIYIKNGMGYYPMIGDMSTEWSTIYYTGTWKKANSISMHLGFGRAIGTFIFKNIKLEKGNKATDWSPAPEDINKEVTEVKQKVSDIVLDINTITSTVESNYYTKNDVDLKGYQTSSQVQQTVNQLQIKFTESGGYNKIRNSKIMETSNGYGFGGRSVDASLMASGNTYTFTVNGRTVNGMGGKYCVIYLYDKDWNWSISISIPETTDTTKSKTFTLPSNILPENLRVSCYHYPNGGDRSGSSRVNWVSLTDGTLSHPWSPHPSEIYDGITTIDKDGITVTSSNVKSKTSMTANGFKITKTDTNEDVFKVNSDGTLNMTGSITTKTSGARSILTGDGINFYNGNTHAGKVSYDTLGAGTVEEARERLWLRSLGGYALKIQSSGDMSLEANGTYNTIFMKGNSLKVTAPTYIYGNLFLNNNNIYAANNVEIKGTLSASSNINVSGKIKAMGNIEINKGTIYLPAGGGNNTAEFIRLANCFMAAVTNSMHFVDINGNKSYLYAASVNTYSLLNNNEILTRSNETALSLMENISVINTSNGYQLKPKYKERTIGKSSIGITLKYDEKNKCEAVEVNINKVINILWKAILELKQEYDSFKNTIIEN